MANSLHVDMAAHRRAAIAWFVAQRPTADRGKVLSEAEQVWLDSMLRFERVERAPNVSPGLDRPQWYLAWQIDDEDTQGIEALWVHTGPAPTQWERIWSGSNNALQIPDFVSTDLADEQVLAEQPYDFTDISGSSKTAMLDIIACALDGGEGTVRIRVGGTPWTVDGSIAVEASVLDATLAIRVGSSALGGFTCPSGHQLVKLTLESSEEGKDVQAQGARVRFV